MGALTAAEETCVCQFLETRGKGEGGQGEAYFQDGKSSLMVNRNQHIPQRCDSLILAGDMLVSVKVFSDNSALFIGCLCYTTLKECISIAWFLSYSPL